MQNVSAAWLLQKPCVTLQANETQRTFFTLRGTGNAPVCAEKVLKLFENFGAKNPHQPAVEGTKFLVCNVTMQHQ